MRKHNFVFLLLLMFVCCMIAWAQPGRDPEHEKQYTSELEAIAPNSVDDFKAGTEAMDADNYEEAARLFEAVTKEAPEFDPALRRLGMSLVALGKRDEGLAYINQAIGIHRSPANLMALARSLAYPAPGKEGTSVDKQQAYALISEAANMPEAYYDPAYKVMQTALAMDLDRISDFRRLTEELAQQHPELVATHYYQAILAATDEKWLTAENEIKTAESLGLPHEVAESFLNAGVRSRARVWHYLIYSLYMVGAWLFGLGSLFLIGKMMSRKTLLSVETSNPNTPASASDIALRKLYRRLINIAGLYYYISIPVVIFLVLAVAASITYGFLMLGRIPIKLVLILCLGALVTSFKMIQTLFVKVPDEDPGRSLSYDEAPALWELTRSVAAAVGTRPVDEIRVTPGTDLAVYEKGSFKERSHDKARRILILGVGVLNDFKQNGFRAVLAHEYGHFSHRDTAGGDVAIRVNNDMMKFAHGIIMSGLAGWWNIGFQFLRVYHFLFRRVTHGATRLQEILADRVAALKYGPQAFEEGLTHVVRKSVEFHSLATEEINASFQAQRALQNLYELKSESTPDMEEEIKKSLHRETSEDDTHPSPNDRFRYTRRITYRNHEPAEGMVWDLFKNREALTAEMTSMVQVRVGSA
jgi:tetratricopeptide (TPR) repeat protein